MKVYVIFEPKYRFEGDDSEIVVRIVQSKSYAELICKNTIKHFEEYELEEMAQELKLAKCRLCNIQFPDDDRKYLLCDSCMRLLKK